MGKLRSLTERLRCIFVVYVVIGCGPGRNGWLGPNFVTTRPIIQATPFEVVYGRPAPSLIQLARDSEVIPEV